MRRWLIALATALVAGALWVGAAYADSTPYHGGYNTNGAGATTSRCAGCHRTHTATGPNLINGTSTYAMCTSCHGATGGVDVVDGVEWQTNSSHAIIPTAPIVGGLKGGGFVSAFMNTTLANAGNPSYTNPTAKAATSAHKVKGMAGYTGDFVWGMGSSTDGAGAAAILECTSCHDPHGGAGGVDTNTGLRIPSYRILRANPAGKVGGSAPNVVVPEDSNTSHEYVVDSSVALIPGTGTPTPPSTLPTTLPNVYSTYYGQPYDNTDMQTLNAWCATCHTRIHTGTATSDPATTSSGDAIFAYRHVTTGTGVENNLGTTTYLPTEAPGCVTCHVGHGTSAASSGRSAQILKPGQTGTNYLDSSLLRLDNHGVCEVCHNK